MHVWIWHSKAYMLSPVNQTLLNGLVTYLIFNQNKVHCTKYFLCYYRLHWLPVDCWIISLSSWDKWDLLTFRVERSESVGGWTDSTLWPLSLNITHCECRLKLLLTVAPFLHRSNVLLKNVYSPWVSSAVSFPFVFIDRPYILRESLHIYLPSIDNSGGYSVIKCAYWDELFAEYLTLASFMLSDVL